MRIHRIAISFFAMVAWGCAFVAPPAHAETKVLLCTGDYGMYAQERAKLIEDSVTKIMPGTVSFQTEQSFDFVKKLENSGYAERFDVILCGDIALGEFTTGAERAMVEFVDEGGGLIFACEAKSTLAFNGPPEAEPQPLAEILPFVLPAQKPPITVREGASILTSNSEFLKGLDFNGTPLAPRDPAAPKFSNPPVLALGHGKGEVLSPFIGWGASYKYVKYATFEKNPNGWDSWPQLGDFWSRLIQRAAAHSPILNQTHEQVDAATPNRALTPQVTVDATHEIDDIRAADFSVVSLSQLYVEDGGGKEDLFLALNPRDWFDRASDLVLDNKAGKAFPDKKVLFDTYHIKGIVHADSTYGSFGQWDEKKWTAEPARIIALANKYPQYLTFFQPCNEPSIDDAYFQYHNRLSEAVLAGAPNLKVLGPNTAFNLRGPDEKSMKAFIDTCGKDTDILNWHTYAVPPENTRAEVLYWSKYAQGKLRSKGPVRVMFTESDAWNTEDSQFDYLMERALTLLPMPQVIANFQYCMDPRYEGGTYWFGVLQPKGEFSANYNGYWIFRNLRGRMVECAVTGAPAEALRHCHAIASNADGGKTVTVVLYYDSGYFDGPAHARADKADLSVLVKLPAGTYELTRSTADWQTRLETPIGGEMQGQTVVKVSLGPSQSAAYTWTRQ